MDFEVELDEQERTVAFLRSENMPLVLPVVACADGHTVLPHVH